MKKLDLSKDEILHLAKLANLSLDDKEIDQYRVQLVETLGYVENLDELDTSKVSPTSSTANLSNIYFEDGTPSDRTLSADEAVSNAKAKKDSLFLVTRIL